MPQDRAMDTLRIKDLAVDCIIGTLPEERTTLQRIWIDAELHGQLSAAGARDDLGYSWNYVDVAKRIAEYCHFKKAYLIEGLADGIAQVLSKEFPIQAVTVRVRKKPAAVPNAACIEVEMHRDNALSRETGGRG